MAFKDYLLAVARGGLPEALDTAIAGGAQGDTRPEQNAPAGTHRDVEPGTNPPQAPGLIASVAPYVPVLIVAGLVVGGVLLMRRKR